MDGFHYKQFNAPNAVVVRLDVHIWFIAPGYGILLNYEEHKGEFELLTNVYRLKPNLGKAASNYGRTRKTYVRRSQKNL